MLAVISILAPTNVLLIILSTEHFQIGPAFLSPIFEATALILTVVIVTSITVYVIAELMPESQV